MRIRLQGPGHAAGLLSELNRCRMSRLYCDVLLQVGNRSFAAHRALLACSGTYFRSLFARSQTPPTSAFTLEFVSPANFERVLTFIYTGEILTDLIDVGVLYELAERLGISELVRACHATFPDLHASVSANCKGNGPGDLGADSSVIAAAAATTVTVSASSVCSSAASCSSLSSSAGPSAATTPAAAPSPFLQVRNARTSREAHTVQLSLELKAEDVHSHLGYGEISADDQLSAEPSLLTNSQSEGALPPSTVFQLKIEDGEERQDAGVRGGSDGGGRMATPRSAAAVSLPQSGATAPPGSRNFPDSSAQLCVEACAPTLSSGDPLGSLQVGPAEGGAVVAAVAARDDGLVFSEVGEGMNEVDEGEEEEEEEAAGERPLQGNGAMDGVEEEEQWRQLAGEIIELSDDEHYMEEEEEDDEDDLVCLENGGSVANSSSQISGSVVSCKACAALVPADPAAVRAHAESQHLTEAGLCRVCGASFTDRAASLVHAMSHVGIQLFSCDMCHLQFCSQSRLLRHRRQAASGYTLPQGALINAAQGQGDAELHCGVCSKTLAKDFQTVREHLLSHVCTQSLSCGVCQLPQLSLCSLLWHTLTHLSLPVYTCPHCAHSFLERPLLDRHMALHADEAASKERERSALRAFREAADAVGVVGVEELHCFLCPQTFRSASAFQYHLSLHTTESLGGGGGGGGGAGGGHGWGGKRRADHLLEIPSSSCSSSSLREAGGLVKMSNLGFSLGMGFGLSDKLLQGPLPSFPAGMLTNGGSELDRVAANVRGKWYRCRYCGKRFAHSGEFTYHLRIHTGEKPYQCKVCLRFFRGRSTMICHLKTHAGALMYRCTVCGLYFSTLKLVSSHMELHKDHLPLDFNIEQTFMYNDHSKEPLPTVDT